MNNWSSAKSIVSLGKLYRNPERPLGGDRLHVFAKSARGERVQVPKNNLSASRNSANSTHVNK